MLILGLGDLLFPWYEGSYIYGFLFLIIGLIGLIHGIVLIWRATRQAKFGAGKVREAKNLPKR